MNIEMICKIAEKYDAETTGDLGFLFADLATGETVAINRDKEMPAASTFKVFLLAEFLRQCEAGKYNLMDRHILTEEFISSGSGILCDLIPGMNLTLLDYARLMMMLSDNSATDYIYGLTGRDNIQENVIEAYGLTNTKCDFPCKKLLSTYFDSTHKKAEGNGTWRNTDDYLCLTPENDSTSPADMAKVLKLAYENQMISPWVSEQMIAIMKLCHTNSRIPKDLPRGVKVAHKTGTLDKLANDCGIVYTEKGDYILCLFYNGNTATQEEYDANFKGRMSDGLLARISKEVYDAFAQD